MYLVTKSIDDIVVTDCGHDFDVSTNTELTYYILTDDYRKTIIQDLDKELAKYDISDNWGIWYEVEKAPEHVKTMADVLEFKDKVITKVEVIDQLALEFIQWHGDVYDISSPLPDHVDTKIRMSLDDFVQRKIMNFNKEVL